MSNNLKFGILLSGILSMTSCIDKDWGNTPTPSKEADVFDFRTSDMATLKVDLGSGHSVELVELYEKNPYDDNGNFDDEQIALCKVFTKSGKFEGVIDLPTHIKEVYVTSYGVDAVCEKVALTADNIISLINAGTSKSVAARSLSYNGTIEYKCLKAEDTPLIDPSLDGKNVYTLFEWDQYGKPAKGAYGLQKPDAEFSSRLYRRIWMGTGSKDNAKKAYGSCFNYINACNESEKTNLDIVAKDIVIDGQTVTADKAHIMVTLFDEYTSSSKNVFGYYYYKTADGAPKNPDDLEKFIIFPNLCVWNSTRNKYDYDGNRYLYPTTNGNQVQLKFHNPETGAFEDEFPAGYTLGWFIIYNGFDGYDIDKKVMGTGVVNLGKKNNVPSSTGNNVSTFYYSNPQYNPVQTTRAYKGSQNKKQYFGDWFDVQGRCMIIEDLETGINVISFEDSDVTPTGNGDGTYDDVIFYVESDPVGVLKNNSGNTTDKEDLPAEVQETQSGTLSFEDVWPSGGDYDLNDVVMEYDRTYSLTVTNTVHKTHEVYRYVHNGATYENGFGIILPYKSSDVESIYIDGNKVEPTTGNAQTYNGTWARWEASSSTDGKIVLVLSDNLKASKMPTDFTVDVTFKGGAYPERADVIKRDIYNPFIIIETNKITSDVRDEIHLPHMAVTKLGEKPDVAEGNYWFVGLDKEGNQFPFAIDIARTCDPTANDTGFYQVPNESNVISVAYPKFANWVKSNGSSDKDWYLSPVEGQVQTVKAYR